MLDRSTREVLVITAAAKLIAVRHTSRQRVQIGVAECIRRSRQQRSIYSTENYSSTTTCSYCSYDRELCQTVQVDQELSLSEMRSREQC
jgi:hypothetical protein